MATVRKMQEIQQYDFVRLTRDLPEVGLTEGTQGTVVEVNGDGEAFEVEVYDETGYTLFLGTLSPDDIEWVETPDWAHEERRAAAATAKTLVGRLKARLGWPTP